MTISGFCCSAVSSACLSVIVRVSTPAYKEQTHKEKTRGAAGVFIRFQCRTRAERRFGRLFIAERFGGIEPRGAIGGENSEQQPDQQGDRERDHDRQRRDG